MRFYFVLLVGLSLAACTNDCTPSEPCANRSFARALAGTWTLAQAAPYQALQVTFTSSGTSVVAAGTYVSSTHSGTVTGRGDVETQPAFFRPSGGPEIAARPSLVMELSYDGSAAHLDQTWFTGSDTLRGVLSFVTPQSATSYGVVFVKSP